MQCIFWMDVLHFQGFRHRYFDMYRIVIKEQRLQDNRLIRLKISEKCHWIDRILPKVYKHT